VNDLLFTLYNNFIIGELVIAALLLLVWAALAIKRLVKNVSGRGCPF
jgi:hypothetical protein